MSDRRIGVEWLGIELVLPPEWSEVPDAVEDAFSAVGTSSPESKVTPTLVVVASQLDEMSLDEWADATHAVLTEQLPTFQALEREPIEVDGFPALRGVATFATPEDAQATLIQVFVASRHIGLSVSMTCASADLPQVGDQFSEILSTVSWEPPD